MTPQLLLSACQGLPPAQAAAKPLEPWWWWSLSAWMVEHSKVNPCKPAFWVALLEQVNSFMLLSLGWWDLLTFEVPLRHFFSLKKAPLFLKCH